MLSSVTKQKEIDTPGQGRAFAYCPPDLDRQVESDPTRVLSMSCTEETPCSESKDNNLQYNMNLLLFVVRYGEPPSLGMLARWRRRKSSVNRMRWRSVVVYDGV